MTEVHADIEYRPAFLSTLLTSITISSDEHEKKASLLPVGCTAPEATILLNARSH